MGEYMKKIKNYFYDILIQIRKPVMSILPGQLSFFFLLSLIPILLIIGIISSSFSVSTETIQSVINKGTPGNISSLLLPLLTNNEVDYNIIILMVSALLLVSKGTRSIMRASGVIYEVEDIKGIKGFIKAFILAIILILLITFIIIIPVFGSKILYLFKQFNIIPDLTDNILKNYEIFKWPISMFVIFINVKILYLFSLNKKVPSSSVNIGAVFTTILWAILTFIYSYYITNMSKYNIFYGGAAKIIVLMLWTYLLSYIFVIGMVINAKYLKENK